MDNKTLFKLTYGLFVITAKSNEKQNGCIANTAVQVTDTPNRICVALNKSNYTHDLILRNKKFNISIIDQEAKFDLFKRFGFQSGRDVDKFDNFSGYKKALNGINYITEGTNAYISALAEETVDLDTHTLFVASITDMEILSNVPSVTYEYYQNNIKPKIAVSSGSGQKKTVWRCRVCGYVYEEEVLPESFICPWCKHPASDFEKVTLSDNSK